MKMIMIENDGEVDVMAFTLMGASTKRGKAGQIGFFGSGNKYAIANLLRRNIDFKIFSGAEEIGVLRQPIVYREQNYEKVAFTFKGDEIQTSLTTSMGPKWEPWYILREIYCNALDEGGCVITTVDEEAIKGEAGKTRIYIQLVDELIAVVNHWNAYFTKDRLDHIETVQADRKDWDNYHEVSIYHKYDDKFRIYRKGVLVYLGEEKSLFDYDLPEADINEERVLTNVYASKMYIGRSISARATAPTLQRVLKGMDRFNRHSFKGAEHDFHLDENIKDNKANWEKALDGLTVINSARKESYQEELKEGNTIMLDSSISYALSDLEGVSKVLGVPRKGLKHSFREVNPTEEQAALLAKAFEFLVLAGLEFGDIQIMTVNFDEYSQTGMADIEGRKIYVGQAVFDKGLKYIVTTLMEEHAHIASRFSDETRAFQNYLIDKWLVEMEKRMEITL